MGKRDISAAARRNLAVRSTKASEGWSGAWCPPGMFVRPRSPGSWRRCAPRPDGFRSRLR